MSSVQRTEFTKDAMDGYNRYLRQQVVMGRTYSGLGAVSRQASSSRTRTQEGNGKPPSQPRMPWVGPVFVSPQLDTLSSSALSVQQSTNEDEPASQSSSSMLVGSSLSDVGAVVHLQSAPPKPILPDTCGDNNVKGVVEDDDLDSFLAEMRLYESRRPVTSKTTEIPPTGETKSVPMTMANTSQQDPPLPPLHVDSPTRTRPPPIAEVIAFDSPPRVPTPPSRIDMVAVYGSLADLVDALNAFRFRALPELRTSAEATLGAVNHPKGHPSANRPSTGQARRHELQGKRMAVIRDAAWRVCADADSLAARRTTLLAARDE